MYGGLCVVLLGLGILVLSLCVVAGLSEFFFLSPLSYPLVSLDFVICLDSVSLLSIYMLVVCSIIAFVYCFHYFSEGSDSHILFLLMVWFVGVMGILMFSYSLVFTLVMWEYLGFVSFLLILFYSNMSSVRASLVTLFSSRFGDVALFALLALSMAGGVDLVWYVLFCFVMIVITKSASFPFISWLLEAMRAPTPVSSLVHSSTLVAAGVWFIVRYGVDMPDAGCMWLFVGSLLTLLITGACAVFFVDLKKIVALSTCNNIAWCLVYYCCGDWLLVMFQLLVHGLSKCVLFMVVGDVMSSSAGAQSYLGVYPARYTGGYGVVLLVLLIFSLCGLPFLGIFFVKHFFLVWSLSGVMSLVVSILLLIGFFLSYIYSMRFMLILCGACGGINGGYVVSFLVISVVSFVGSLISFFVVGGTEELEMLSGLVSLLFIGIQLGGLIVGYIIYNAGFEGSFWDSVLWGNDGLVGACYSLFDKVSGVCVLSFYRWEVSFLGSLLGKMVGVKWSSVMAMLSFNFVVIGIFYYVFIGLFLF